MRELENIRSICKKQGTDCGSCPFDDLSYCYFENRRPENWDLRRVLPAIRKISKTGGKVKNSHQQTKAKMPAILQAVKDARGDDVRPLPQTFA